MGEGEREGEREEERRAGERKGGKKGHECTRGPALGKPASLHGLAGGALL